MPDQNFIAPEFCHQCAEEGHYAYLNSGEPVNIACARDSPGEDEVQRDACRAGHGKDVPSVK